MTENDLIQPEITKDNKQMTRNRQPTVKDMGYRQVIYVLTKPEQVVVDKAISALGFENPLNKWKTLGSFTKDVIMTYCKNVNRKHEAGKQNG